MLSTLTVLKNRNYRLYFAGQFLSLSGNWMQSIAQSWLVYRLSGSASWLGLILFTSQVPAFFVSPIAGVVADRFCRRKILLALQWIFVVQALLLTFLVFFDLISLWQILVLSCLLGVINGFDMTTRHAFVVDMVGKEDLHHAIALNSVMINGGRIIGPSIAGIIIAIAGEKWCFALNALSFCGVIYVLYRMKIAPATRSENRENVVHLLSSGWGYVRRHRLIIRIIAVMSFISFITPAGMVLLPVFAKQVLHGDARTYSWLMTTIGVGAIVGALIFGSRHDVKNLKHDLAFHLGAMGISMALIGLSTNFWLSLGAVTLFGCFMMSSFPRLNNAIQHVVDDEMRGRVMSIYTMGFLGTTPLGSLIAGWLADRIGPRLTVSLSGLICVMTALALRSKVLNLHSRRGRGAPQEPWNEQHKASQSPLF